MTKVCQNNDTCGHSKIFSDSIKIKNHHKMDWDQILLRKVSNITLPSKYLDKVDTSVVIGKGCELPMVCNTPFIFEIDEEHFSSQSHYPNDCNFLVSYKTMEKESLQINRNYILELNGDIIDTKLLKGLEIGAFCIDLNPIYSTLMQYNQSHSACIKKGMKLPIYHSEKNKIDLSKLYNQKYSTGEWVMALRKLRSEVPFGIRLPANFIERDVILSLTCEADFIILDCSDSIMKKENVIHPIIPSLPAISRIKKILSKLNNQDITLIVGMPCQSDDIYLKMFALGAGLILINNTVSGELCNEEEAICQQKDIALEQLKKNILECGYNDLNEITKDSLVTDDLKISELTDIASVFDPDKVCLPCYNIKRKFRSREFTS